MTNFYVEGCESMPPGVNLISLDWLDGERCVDAVTNDSFGVYCPIADVINNTLYDNGDLCNPSGIVVGTNACFAIEFQDFEQSPQDVTWSIVEGIANFAGGINQGIAEINT